MKEEIWKKRPERRKRRWRAQKLEAPGIIHNQNKGQRGMASCTATVEIDIVNLEMEVDPGSAESIIGKDTSRFF